MYILLHFYFGLSITESSEETYIRRGLHRSLLVYSIYLACWWTARQRVKLNMKSIWYILSYSLTLSLSVSSSLSLSLVIHNSKANAQYRLLNKVQECWLRTDFHGCRFIASRNLIQQRWFEECGIFFFGLMLYLCFMFLTSWMPV